MNNRQALDLAIFAINNHLAPDASSANDVTRFEEGAEEALNILAGLRDEEAAEADIRIESYDPGNGRADLEVLVDGESYTVTWDDDEGDPQIMGTDPLPDVLYPVVKERLELFFTFYDNAQLKDEKERLTAEAVGAMNAHLAQNEVGR